MRRWVSQCLATMETLVPLHVVLYFTKFYRCKSAPSLIFPFTNSKISSFGYRPKFVNKKHSFQYYKNSILRPSWTGKIRYLTSLQFLDDLLICTLPNKKAL